MKARSIAPTSAQAPTAASILNLIAALGRRDPADPAVIAFRTALTRKGREADAVSAPTAVATLIRAIAADDPTLAERRLSLIREAWA